jgi:hypothetical protein
MPAEPVHATFLDACSAFNQLQELCICPMPNPRLAKLFYASQVLHQQQGQSLYDHHLPYAQHTLRLPRAMMCL